MDYILKYILLYFYFCLYFNALYIFILLLFL